ncbi:unnamed protein product [Brachionus calyciflorus]|uniref:Uncharacterized protein n=1 Tax=Brachionus calyciflorus TaxID=104777 RepID=A0A814N4Z4_9BILA|nr:unnamed protein product [Brachionus calyciflorus]
MVDGQSSSYYKPLEFNFPKNQYIRGYYSLFENIDKPVFATDLCSGDQFNINRTGNLDVGLTFADSLDDSIVVIFYLEHDNLVEINNKFEVSYDYKI